MYCKIMHIFLFLCDEINNSMFSSKSFSFLRLISYKFFAKILMEHKCMFWETGHYESLFVRNFFSVSVGKMEREREKYELFNDYLKEFAHKWDKCDIRIISAL